MARKSKSKYQQMVGTITEGVMIVDYERQTKVSKGTNKKYYSYRLWVTADGEHMVEISTQSWNKWSFMKRLEKVTTAWIYLDETGAKAKEERKRKAKAKPKARKSRVEDDGLTEQERKRLIRKYGYCGMFMKNENGERVFVRADEIEEPKAKQRERERAERAEREAKWEQEQKEWEQQLEEEMKQFEYESMIGLAYDGLASAHEKLTMDIKEIKTKCLLYGFVTSKEVYIEKAFDYVLNKMELDHPFTVAWHDETVYQLNNEYGKFLDEIWDEVEEYVRLAWSLTDEGKQAKRDAEWREYQQFIGANRVEGRNEYDEMFDGLDEKQAKRMYHKLSRQLHPDVPTGSQQEFQAMHEAYERHGVVREVSFEDWWFWKEWGQEFDITLEEWMQPSESFKPKYLCA